MLITHASAAAQSVEVNEKAMMSMDQTNATIISVRARRFIGGVIISVTAPTIPPTPPAARMNPNPSAPVPSTSLDHRETSGNYISAAISEIARTASQRSSGVPDM